MKSSLRAAAFATTTAVMAITVPAAKADPNLQTHAYLWQTLQRAGVPIFVNDDEECGDNWGGGSYMSAVSKRRSAILICQDNGKGVGEGNLVPFSLNDLDSLRHEAHHVVQDCLAGDLADGEMETMFRGEQLKSVVISSLSQSMIQNILKNYDEEHHLLELEAFAVAAHIDPDDIAGAIEKFCF